MNDPFLAVHLRDLAITPLVFPSDNPHFIILSYRKCPCLAPSQLSAYGLTEEDKTHVVFAAQLFRQRRRHNLAANRGGRREMMLARLAPGGRDICKKCGISTPIQKYRCSCPSRPHLNREPTIHLDSTISSKYILHNDKHNSQLQQKMVETNQGCASF
jgi:hypothetical protein